MRPRRWALVVASAAYAVVLWYLTLRPVPYEPEVQGIVDLVVAWFARYDVTAWLTLDRVEFLSNVGLFVPFGALAVLWGARWWIAVVCGLAASGIIELVQLSLLAERVPDIRDLVANTTGAAVGAALTILIVRAVRRRSRGSDVVRA
ncbi:VanZ family protein [Microbacterium sp. SLBN-146]|uniref:VanZ family protein n=1 Tax=Microbacterium sp. SLBN-146 TaxID=2768457 RepID=UPI0011501C04|nr:VanZ family protein [Microbacterium sp. SLBN-146]TQJ31647.1 VanZ like protein [Microbacterium sp. SLBN-146]